MRAGLDQFSPGESRTCAGSPMGTGERGSRQRPERRRRGRRDADLTDGGGRWGPPGSRDPGPSPGTTPCPAATTCHGRSRMVDNDAAHPGSRTMAALFHPWHRDYCQALGPAGNRPAVGCSWSVHTQEATARKPAQEDDRPSQGSFGLLHERGPPSTDPLLEIPPHYRSGTHYGKEQGEMPNSPESVPRASNPPATIGSSRIMWGLPGRFLAHGPGPPPGPPPPRG